MSEKPIMLESHEAIPCPFCGELPQIEPWHGRGPRKRMVSCSNDGCAVSPQVTGTTRSIALKFWNHREPPAACSIQAKAPSDSLDKERK